MVLVSAILSTWISPRYTYVHALFFSEEIGSLDDGFWVQILKPDGGSSILTLPCVGCMTWTSHVTSPCLSFLICQTELSVVFGSQG